MKSLFRNTIFCGIALVAVAPYLGHAQTVESAAASPATLFVDCGATFRGNGSEKYPYWRITDALERARHIRRQSPLPIVIRVAVGICSGNFEAPPIDQTTRPPELLPLVVNIPNLTLHGAGVMDYADGYPIALRHGSETTLTVDTPRLGVLDNSVIYVGPTADGGRADGAVIEGFEIDEQFNGYDALYINRTQRFVVRSTVIEHVAFGAVNCSECSGRFTGNVVHDGQPALLLAAGTPGNPSRVYVGGNSFTNNFEGVVLFGDSMYTERVDMGANPIVPMAYPISPTDRQVGTRLDVEIAGNDVSRNYGDGGLKLSIQGGSRYPYSQTGNISARVHDNRFIDNAGYPFAVNEGFVFRATSSYWTNPDPNDFPVGYLGFLAAPFVTQGPFDGPYSGNVDAVMENNIWTNPTVTPVAPAILTFSYIDVYDPATGEPDPTLVQLYPYMRNSRLRIVDHDGLLNRAGVVRDDLRLYDPLDGVALLNQTYIRR